MARLFQAPAAGIIAVLLLFAGLSTVVYVNNQDPETRRIRLVAQQYADAWRTGRLASLEYDKLSNPDVGQGDPGRINDNVRWIVNGLDGAIDDHDDVRPAKVMVDAGSVKRDGKELADATLWVTWKLEPTGLAQVAHSWTYAVTLQERLVDGRWRVVWTPKAVHPAIRHGMVLEIRRSFAARGRLIGANNVNLPPSGEPYLAKALLGSLRAMGTHEQSELSDLRVTPREQVGVGGLQDLYDDRLGGSAQIQVVAMVHKNFKGTSTPTEQTVFVGAPDTPRPVRLTLSQPVQEWAESALAGITNPAALVVVKQSTGELLAVANTPTTGTPEQMSEATNYGLLAQQSPGPIFQLASTLALLRSPARSLQSSETYKLTTRIDCSQPYTVGDQVFRNSQGKSLAGVQLGAAVEGGCITGLARAAADVSPATLQTAAYDLGLATPQQSTNGAPGLLSVADQLGVPAFHGTVQPTEDDPATDPVSHAETMAGQGDVLVSPLSMARAMATIASGTRHSVRLVTLPVAQRQDTPKNLGPGEAAALQTLLTGGVTEPGGSAHALAPLGDVHALAGTAPYGTGYDLRDPTDPDRRKSQNDPKTKALQQRETARQQGWCAGYLGDYAFAVLVQNGGTQAQAVTIASKFLDATG